jgi:hypothetical protein
MNTTVLHPWRPLFWEPVSGTGERLMVGVVYVFDDSVQATRIIRDDVLDSLYGHASAAARKLIDTSLNLYSQAAKVGGIGALSMPLMGLYPGELRATEAGSQGELLRTAALLYSSLSNLDKLDDLEESDSPQAEEVSRRFSTEVKEIVMQRRPELYAGFGKSGSLIDGGQVVKFGYFSPLVVIHFSVLHPVRQGPSVRDARARLWELQRAMAVSGVNKAAIITAVPRLDDATLGDRQRVQAKANEKEIEHEADAQNILMFPVHSADEGASCLIKLAA